MANTMTTNANKPGHILVVDDNPIICLSVSEELLDAGYTVVTASSGEETLVRLEEDPVIDLVLLDLRMDGMDGLQVMSKIKQLALPPVVIVHTAYADLDSSIQTMRLSGYDYLIKPCPIKVLLDSIERGLAHRRQTLHQQEMIHRIENAARQLRGNSDLEPEEPITQNHLLERRGLLLDQERHIVIRSGQPVHLTLTEFRLLLALMKRANRVLSFHELICELHSGGERTDDPRRALGTHLWRLRKKIGCDSDGIPYIVNVRGVGYKFGNGKETDDD